MSEPLKKISGHGDLVDEITHLIARAEYWQKRCEAAELAAHGETSSIPALIAIHGGNLTKVTKETGMHFNTVSNYRFDVKCEKHVIVKGRLFTRNSRYGKSG